MEMQDREEIPSSEQSILPRWVLILTGVIVVVAVSTVSFMLGTRQQMRISTIAEGAPTPTPTPAVYPTPTIVEPSIVGEKPTHVRYTDADIPFTVTYPYGWILKKTYGKNIQKQAPTDVVTGIEIDSQNSLSTFVVNLIDPKLAPSITDWWKKGSHVALDMTQPNFSFRGIDAIKVSGTPGGNPPARVQDEVYFLNNGFVYFISMQYTPYSIDKDLIDIYNNFQLSQK